MHEQEVPQYVCTQLPRPHIQLLRRGHGSIYKALLTCPRSAFVGAKEDVPILIVKLRYCEKPAAVYDQLRVGHRTRPVVEHDDFRAHINRTAICRLTEAQVCALPVPCVQLAQPPITELCSGDSVVVVVCEHAVGRIVTPYDGLRRGVDKERRLIGSLRLHARYDHASGSLYCDFLNPPRVTEVWHAVVCRNGGRRDCLCICRCVRIYDEVFKHSVIRTYTVSPVTYRKPRNTDRRGGRAGYDRTAANGHSVRCRPDAHGSGEPITCQLGTACKRAVRGAACSAHQAHAPDVVRLVAKTE